MLLLRREYWRAFVLPLLEFGRTTLCCSIRPSSPLRFMVVFGHRKSQKCGFSRPPILIISFLLLSKIGGPRENTFGIIGHIVISNFLEGQFLTHL